MSLEVFVQWSQGAYAIRLKRIGVFQDIINKVTSRTAHLSDWNGLQSLIRLLTSVISPFAHARMSHVSFSGCPEPSPTSLSGRVWKHLCCVNKSWTASAPAAEASRDSLVISFGTIAFSSVFMALMLSAFPAL